jgi:AcrR family transcriptional regulator
MRVKSDTRREAILEIAKDLFREVGYERASMAMISARVGGSKATLYSYFKSKEALFAAAMIAAMEEQAQGLLNLLDPEDTDLRAVLVRFGHAYLALLTSADALAITRTAIAEGTASGLGTELYELGPRRGWGRWKPTCAPWWNVARCAHAIRTSPPGTSRACWKPG